MADQALGNPRGLQSAARAWRGIAHGHLAWLIATAALLTSTACHRLNGTPPPDTTETSDEVVTNDGPAPPPEPLPVVWPVVLDDPDRWLTVEGVREGEEGAWATGSFDPKRNKLDIRTHGARKFAINTSRVRINWERLVILGIDGANSELRRRDFRVYHFELDDHGRWVVLEP